MQSIEIFKFIKDKELNIMTAYLYLMMIKIKLKHLIILRTFLIFI